MRGKVMCGEARAGPRFMSQARGSPVKTQKLTKMSADRFALHHHRVGIEENLKNAKRI